MTLDRINPPGLAAPRGFSHAVSTTRQRTVYLAGQTALDPDARIVGDDVVSQFEQALSNLMAQVGKRRPALFWMAVALAAAPGARASVATTPTGAVLSILTVAVVDTVPPWLVAVPV